MLLRATLIAVLLGCAFSRYAQAQASAMSKSDCGSPPSQFAESETTDTKIGGGFSGIFKQGAANGDYEKAVTKTRQEVYSHYPNAAELDRQQYADYVTCVLIVTDPDLNGEGRRKAWLEYQKTKDQPVETELQTIQNTLQTIKKMLENPSKNVTQLTKFIDTQRLEAKYPLGYALFYSDGRKTLYYGNPNTFDPASIQVVSFGQNEMCFNANLKGTQWDDACVDITAAPGPHTLQVSPPFHFYVELLAQSAGEAAWMIGVRDT
jgi:5S rRNA maturation endonuclease (ribonuclease M5)